MPKSMQDTHGHTTHTGKHIANTGECLSRSAGWRGWFSNFLCIKKKKRKLNLNPLESRPFAEWTEFDLSQVSVAMVRASFGASKK